MTQTNGYGDASSTMKKRERLKATRLDGAKNRLEERAPLVLWYDTGVLSLAEGGESFFERVAHGETYSGALVSAERAREWSTRIPARMDMIVACDAAHDLASAHEAREARATSGGSVIVASADRPLLEAARVAGFATCLRAYVDDRESLLASVHLGSAHAYLAVHFRDPTNIPLELVIASLQATDTVLVKEIDNSGNVEDAVVTLGVMEVGADGVLFSPLKNADYDALAARIAARDAYRLSIEPATVIRTEAIGMGHRSCIDLTTLFSETEGMLVGSTSQGAILCCPEVFFLPYMELRPFRVNAGAVHSYVYNQDNRTDYMTELRAGSSVTIVDAKGVARRAAVGRMKTEVRPLRLIEIEFASGERANVIMQDDWHVRVFSAESKPLNITELKAGDRVLGHLAKPGRHVGIAVDEHIVET